MSERIAVLVLKTQELLIELLTNVLPYNIVLIRKATNNSCLIYTKDHVLDFLFLLFGLVCIPVGNMAHILIKVKDWLQNAGYYWDV